MKKHFPIFLILFFLLAGCAVTPRRMQPVPIFAPEPQAGHSEHSDELTPRELQAAIMAFADTTNSRLAEAARIIENLGTPQARLTAARMMVYNTASHIEIAAGPYPGIALLDMMVINTLRRMIWDAYWVPEVFGEQAAPVLLLMLEIEEDIWTLAAKVMTPEQMEEVRRVIRQWRKKNPHSLNVNYVRFDDFGELGLKPSMRNMNIPGGLFDSVKEAAMVAQDMKVAIDRAFYLVSRMQVLLNFQAKLAYLELLFQPETNGIIDSTKQVMGISERYAEIAENLPEDARANAAILMEEMFENIEGQTNSTLKLALEGMTSWQSQTINDVMVNISKEREAAINQAVSGLVDQQSMLFDRVDDLVNKSGGEMEQTLNHAFLLGVLLIVVFFVLLTLYRVCVVRPVSKK